MDDRAEEQRAAGIGAALGRISPMTGFLAFDGAAMVSGASYEETGDDSAEDAQPQRRRCPATAPKMPSHSTEDAQPLSVTEQQAAAARTAPPEGWRYETEFLSGAEESELLQLIATLPLQAARYREWTARRRIVSFGGRYDFSQHRLDPAEPIPPALGPLRERVAAWGELATAQLTHATVAEYQSGTQLGWHRDVPEFEVVLGVSLAGRARMRFRPYPHHKGSRTVFVSDLEPRSIYLMRGPVRWRWQHAISATHELRYSITFRTRRTARSS